MGLSRRSFLAAVMACAPVPVVARAISDVDISTRVWKFGTLDDYVMMHYTAWDSAVVAAGRVLNERLLPPPAPLDFLITAIGLHFNAEAPCESLSRVVEDVSLSIHEGGREFIQVPLRWFGGERPFPLAVPFMFEKPDDLAIRLRSFDLRVRSEESVTVSVILQGMVRRPRDGWRWPIA